MIFLKIVFLLSRSIGGIAIKDEPVDAKSNWWGSERESYINGKVWDRLDNTSLVDIVFSPWRVSNASLIDGRYNGFKGALRPVFRKC